MIVEGLSRSDICDMIDEWVVGRNAERDRAILKRRLVDGVTYERLAEEFDLSPRQVQNVMYKREKCLLNKKKPLE